jgi:hypothetical protein
VNGLSRFDARTETSCMQLDRLGLAPEFRDKAVRYIASSQCREYTNQNLPASTYTLLRMRCHVCEDGYRWALVVVAANHVKTHGSEFRVVPQNDFSGLVVQTCSVLSSLVSGEGF